MIKKILKILVLAGVVILVFGFMISFKIEKSSRNFVFSEAKDVPETQVALVLGARVWQNDILSHTLQDRVDTSIELYKLGKVKKFLLSGDHGREEYDEVNAMKKYLLEKGVPAKDIFLDHAGFDTYDSIYRAKEIFEVESVTIVTQEFHLPRSVYVAKSLDIKAYGVVADKRIYLMAKRNALREKVAQQKAFFNCLFNSKPKFLGDKIPISGDGRKSWD